MNCIDCSYSLLKDGHYNCTYEEGECIKISVLEKENAKLERKLEQTEKDLADYQFNYPTIKELQKENAELKEHHKSVCDTLTNTHRHIRGKLAEAKAIIRDLLRVTYGEGWNYSLGVKAMAEQFLKEVSE